MKYIEPRVFNLKKERPNVLLFGNGLIRNISIPWEKLIKKVCREGVDWSRYEETDYTGKHIKFYVPNTILTLATSDIEDKKRRQKYNNAFNKENREKKSDNTMFNLLLSLPWDAILTTNYTYELETALNPRYSQLSSVSKREYAATTKKKADTKYLLHTFNRICSDAPDIWHIHGELRRPSSMILSHDEYARYIHMILAYNKDRGNTYTKFRQELKFKSWIDYFLLGDVYVLGLGMDFSEFDLWWLLGRRLRENTECGKFVFYEPQNEGDHHKQFALSDSGVDVETFGMTAKGDLEYKVFYRTAITDIAMRISKGGN